MRYSLRMANGERNSHRPHVQKRKETEPLISYYEKQSVVKSIDATGTVDEVAVRVDEVIAVS